MIEKALLDRLTAMERENRRLKALTAAVLALVATLGWFGQARAAGESAVLEAQRFVVKDIRGRERAVLGIDPDGSARLTFLREDGSKGNSFSEKAGPVPVH